MPYPLKPRIPIRHELKYYINYGEYLHLSRTIDHVMWRDENADEYGEYHIRSLYFDDVYNTAMVEKLAGIENRNKYRIRIYNYSDKQIILERKTKIGDGISKTSAPLTRSQCEALIDGDASVLDYGSKQHPLYGDMFIQMTTRLLRPSVLVDYTREAYVHPAENVRITFDKQLRTGLFSHELFDRWLPTMSPLDSDYVILEVKYDDYLPEYIKKMLWQVESMRSAISKYVLCRRYDTSV